MMRFEWSKMNYHKNGVFFNLVFSQNFTFEFLTSRSVKCLSQNCTARIPELDKFFSEKASSVVEV